MVAGGSAAFIPAAIVLQEDALRSRATNQPINQIMQTHRGLEPDDIEFFREIAEPGGSRGLWQITRTTPFRVITPA